MVGITHRVLEFFVYREMKIEISITMPQILYLKSPSKIERQREREREQKNDEENFKENRKELSVRIHQ